MALTHVVDTSALADVDLIAELTRANALTGSCRIDGA
jgi:hypothetical protein